jgi:hypothetical protein
MSDAVRDFVLAIEKTLATRRLYAPHMEPYQDASRKLLEKCRAAVGESGFTLRVGPMDLFLEKKSLINRPKREEAFFFPLYRDGLRELSISSEIAAPELEALLRVLEAEEKRTLGPADDTVNMLWRSDLTAVTYSAIDGIGDQEGDDGPDGGKDDFGVLVTELAEKIKNPAPPTMGQSYAFVVDADVHVAASDFHYEAATARKAFEDNPQVHVLSAEEAESVRAQLGQDRDADLLARFLEILFVIFSAPASPVPPAQITPVLQKLLEGYWAAGDYTALEALLGRLRAAAESAPTSESRGAAAELIGRFLGAERIRTIYELVQRAALPLPAATRIVDQAGESAWPALVDLCARLPEGELRFEISRLLRSRLSSNPELLRGVLTSPELPHVKLALGLVDRRLEAFYAKELLHLAAHAEEAIRLKGLAAAARVGGAAAHEALWKAMQSDASKSVRLFAFRTILIANPPWLADRLRKLVAEPSFGARPAWEREKYVRLLGTVAGASVAPLFESWIPKKRWFWQDKDSEEAEVALRGLLSCGGAAAEKVKKLAVEGGKLGDIAKKVIESAKRDIGETVMVRGEAPAPDATAPPRSRT